MRKLIVALVPLAFAAACSGADAPAEEVSEAAAKPPAKTAEAEAKPAPKAKVQVTEAAGTWTRTSNGSRPMVTYASAEGETLFSATCMPAAEETGGVPALEITSVSSPDDSASSIDIYTSAGNARIGSQPDKTSGVAFGITETVGQAPYVLAAGAGEIKVVSGTRGVTFETNQMLEDLIEDCRPAFVPGQDTADEADDEKGEEATDADAEESATGT